MQFLLKWVVRHLPCPFSLSSTFSHQLMSRWERKSSFFVCFTSCLGFFTFDRCTCFPPIIVLLYLTIHHHLRHLLLRIVFRPGPTTSWPNGIFPAKTLKTSLGFKNWSLQQELPETIIKSLKYILHLLRFSDDHLRRRPRGIRETDADPAEKDCLKISGDRSTGLPTPTPPLAWSG